MSKATIATPRGEPAALDWYKAENYIAPELCYIVSVAVGFAVAFSMDIYTPWDGGPKRVRYRIKRRPGMDTAGFVFRARYRTGRRDFETPEAAAAEYVRAWLDWKNTKPGEAA